MSVDVCWTAGTSSFCNISVAMVCFIVEYCLSNADCSSDTGLPVCKETVYGGAKTCQAENSCKQACSDEQFCDFANICKNGQSAIFLII